MCVQEVGSDFVGNNDIGSGTGIKGQWATVS